MRFYAGDDTDTGKHITISQTGDFMQSWAETFYKSTAWQRCRALAIKRDSYLCQDCLRLGRITPAEEVHHIQPLTPENIRRPEVTLNLENLVSLCRECHKARHGERQKRYEVDAQGRVRAR